MGHATFLDLVKSIRKIRYKDIVDTIDLYQWELGGMFILYFLVYIFGDILSFTFLNLLLAYFWNWTLASPRLIKKGKMKAYRFSIMRLVINFERKLRVNFLLPMWPSTLNRSFYRPTGRILSVIALSIVGSLLLDQFLIHWFLLGAVLFEFFNTLKYFSR